MRTKTQERARHTPSRRTRERARTAATREARERYCAEGVTACEACGWQTPQPDPQQPGTMAGLQVHHIIPVSRGGGDEGSNLILLCATCHVLCHHLPRVRRERYREFVIEALRAVQRPRPPIPAREPTRHERKEINAQLRAKALDAAMTSISNLCHDARPATAYDTVQAIFKLIVNKQAEWSE